jgi:hypothetical protein
MAFATWNPADKSANITLSGGNLVSTNATSGSFGSVRATEFKNSGKWYCELTVTQKGDAGSDVPILGISNSSFAVTGGNYDSSADIWAYKANGAKVNGGVSGYGASFDTGDVISALFDADAGTLTFWKNGTTQGEAFSGISDSLAITHADFGAGTVGSVVTLNSGGSAFVHTPPEGYSGWDDGAPSNDLDATAPLPALLMGGGASLGVTAPAPVMAMVSDGMNIIIPAPVLVMTPPTILTLGAVAPAPVLAMSGAVGLNISTPSPVLAFTGDSAFNVFAVAVPSPAILMDGIAGSAFGLSLIVPGPILALGGAPTLAITVPVTASFSGINGAVGAVKVTVPYPEFSASGQSEVLGGLNINASLKFSMTMMSENLGTMRPIIVRPRFVATALSGADATMAMVLPFTASFSGYGPYEGSMAIFYQAPTVEIGITSEISSATRTWVLNLRRKALTEYTNYGFNSYGHFRDAMLSAGDDGLFLHAGQDSDDGDPIAARVRTGKESFGTSFNKRVPRIYASFRANGGMRFTTITSQGGERVYALPYNGLDEIQERRVPVGRGPKSPYWQFEMLNVDGSDFLIEKMQPYPEQSNRRVV